MTHESSLLLVLGDGEAGGRERLAPPLAGRGLGREAAWLSAGPPGGYVPTAECRWAASWPAAAEQLEGWSVC